MQDFIMLLRKAHNLKLMNYLFLEFFIYIFRLDDYRQLKPWTGGTTPGERSGSERGCSIFFLVSFLFNNLSSKPSFLFFLPLGLHLGCSSPNHFSVYSIILYPLTSSNTTPSTHTHRHTHTQTHTHTDTHTHTESLESRELQILLLSHSPSYLAGHRDVSPPSHLYVTPSTRA